ncbi:FadR/GntR family transcriptional regulator [Ktedonosporobacter rubrisoli]|uniref:FadR/GntR family transcriptional regulator n=1 Tax=Ktedonosporobacter rubrisoli TaxID=2509675 RepID=UPI001A92FEF3|nr:FadR/GntR family transcriptional regulator [Ktedonosporobacter rubrisoli]
MALKEAIKSTLVTQVIAQMKGLIEEGEWVVGTRIPPEPELVKQLGVSRNTVREAVQALVHMGLLETRQGDGTYVRSQSELGATLMRRLRRSGVEETLEVRHCLEREAARLAALRRSDEDVQILRLCLKLHDEAMRCRNIEDFLSADLALHHAIVAAAHNSVMLDLYDHMSEAVRASISSMIPKLDHVLVHRLLDLHHELVEAVIAKNAEAAEVAARKHDEVVQTMLQERATQESEA